MRAIRVSAFGGPDVMKLEYVADPIAGAGEVVVRLHATGVNPADTYMRSGNYATKPQLPYTPGGEGAGVIEALGNGVVELKIGERVWISATQAGRLQGAYAELAVCAAQDVHPLPDALSFAQGAAINIAYVTAYRALFDRAKMQAGEIVLIHGATGGVGLAAVQVAAHFGAIVLGTGGSDDGRALAKVSGAADVFDHHDPAYREKIMAATRGDGCDVIIEMLANVNLDHDLAMLSPGGRVVVIGSRGRIEIDPRQMMAKESSVTGVMYWGGGDAAVRRAIAAISAGLRDGVFVPHAGQSFDLADAAKAHETVMAHTGATGKITLSM